MAPIANNKTPILYYVIEQTTSNNWKPLDNQVIAPSTSSFIKDGIIPSTTYRFRVYAYSSVSYSLPGNEAVIVTPAGSFLEGMGIEIKKCGRIVNETNIHQSWCNKTQDLEINLKKRKKPKKRFYFNIVLIVCFNCHNTFFNKSAKRNNCRNGRTP